MNQKVQSLIHRVVYFTIKNPVAAKSLTNHLIKSPKDKILIPFVDHPGPLSNEILSKQFGSLTVCERDDAVREKFSSYVKNNFPNKNIKIYSDDLYDISFKSYSDEAQKRCSEIVRETMDIGHSSDEQSNCDTYVKLLVPLMKSRYEASYLKNLYNQISLRIGLCSNNLVHYYFMMSERQFNYLIAKPGQNFHLYRSSTILYNTIFNVHKLDTYDLKSCFGINLNRIQSTSPSNKTSYQNVYLVWLEPRRDIIDKHDGKSLMEFRFLVTQIMHRRKCFVINSLEKWFDNCSGDLEKYGITKITRSGDLAIEQYSNLFMYLKNREDYNGSTFRQAAATSEENILPL